jgi:hypothetical protein
MDAEVNSVHYHFKADDEGLATHYVDIEPIGFMP